MKKKLLSLVLAMAMALSLLPAPAFAADKEPTLTGAEMVALLPSERPEVTAPESVGLAYNEEDEERTFKEIAELTRSLAAGKTTETEKAHAIFEWVAENVEYDLTAFDYWGMQKRGDRLTEEQNRRLSQAANGGYAFYNRRAICQGYTGLANFMLLLVGLPAAAIVNETHAWSAVYADGRWILFDATAGTWDESPNAPIEEITWPDGIWRMKIAKTGRISCSVQNQYRNDLTSVTIPDCVNVINTSAFVGCANLTSVDIPENVTFIGNSAFSGCSSLKRVTIPDSVTTIEGSAFMCCYSLTEVNIPKGLTEIGQYTFASCSSLTSVTIPDSVTAIGASAFKDCTSLTSVTIPASVTKMESGVFEKCTALTRAVFGGGLTSISSSTFWGCDSLASVAIPTSVTSIGSSAFYNCPNLTDVYYSGSEEQWDAIEIGTFSSFLKRNSGSTRRITYHYNTVGGFGDVNTGAYYAGAVQWAVASGVTTGKTAATFAPNETCTHAQILTFLYRAARNQGKAEAADMDKAVAWAREKGMIGAGFNPKAPCTRADAVNYIWQAFGRQDAKASSFIDVDANAGYAKAVDWAVANSVTNGTNTAKTEFSPNQVCTRGHIVTFLHRAYVPGARL